MLPRAAAVALAAVVVGWFGVTSRAVPLSSADFGNFLFDALGSDLLLVALPPAFSRFTIPASEREVPVLRCAWAAVVGAVALGTRRCGSAGDDFAWLFAVQSASYLFMIEVPLGRPSRVATVFAGAGAIFWSVKCGVLLRGLQLLACLLFGFVGYYAQPGRRWVTGTCCCGVSAVMVLSPIGSAVLAYLLPVDELRRAFVVVAEFVGEARLSEMCMKLFVTTVNIQIPLGFLGIAFLRRAQGRFNQLLAVGERTITAQQYLRLVGVYMLAVALPYLLQRTLLEGVNSYAFGCFAREVERALRVESLFPLMQGQDALLAAVASTNLTVGSHSEAFNSVVSLSYSTIERKLFSLPKLALLPMMLWSSPWLIATVLPGSIALDMGKSQVVGMLSGRIESFNQQIQELSSRRQQVEQHDTKHEEVIRRGAATPLAKTRWINMSTTLADLQLRHDALANVRSFVEWLYWQDFMIPGIECALGFLLEMGQISNVDIMVYTRVVEDAIDLLLTRSRLQSELATMETNMDRLRLLSSHLSSAKARGRANCVVDAARGSLDVSAVEYRRGSVLRVRIPELVLRSGQAYALTGANGCGKSTFFAILAGCGRQAPALPADLELESGGSFLVPSDDVVEITQKLYCPLFTRPIDWMLQSSEVELLGGDALRQREDRVAALLEELAFRDRRNSTNESEFVLGSHMILDELRAEHEDWYGSLSGGQRVKAEIVRKVFMMDECPKVLLLDEVFAPLDPLSKTLVQRKLKEFCTRSVVLVVYHSDANEACLRGGGFFDDNLRFSNGTARLVGTC